MSLNKAMLIGNVGKEPEVRYLEGNNKVASFTLATSEKFTDRSGQLKERTEWHNIVVFGKQVDNIEKYVHKGTQLYVEGRIQSRSWDGQDGVKHYTTEINVSTFQMLGKRESNQDGTVQGRQAAPYQGDAPAGFGPRTTYQAPVQPGPAVQTAPQPEAPHTLEVNPVDEQTTADNSEDLPF